MKIKEAFTHQIETTRLIVEDDLKESDSIAPAVWNGVIIRPEGNFYSSGKEMKVGDKLLVGYVISETTTPKPILIEEKELDDYESKLKIVRVWDGIPVMEEK